MVPMLIGGSINTIGYGIATLGSALGVAGDASPVLAAVGPMQFEVVTARMKTEFNVDTVIEPLGYSLARRTDADSAAELNRQRGVEVFTRTDGVMLALVSAALSR